MVRRATSLVVALVLAGACTPESSDPGGTASPRSSPVLGGEISVGVLGEPSTLDPYAATASDLTYALARPVYRMPYRLLPDGSIEPDLATSLEIEGQNATLTLDDARWSDGEPISARDVVESIDRATPPSGFAAIRDARIIDRKSIELRGPVASWERTLASGAYVLPGGRFKGRLAAGPWRFEDLDAGRRLSYVPNPSWEGPALFLDGLSVDFVNTTQLLVMLLERGDLDVAAIPLTVNLDERLDEMGISYDRALGWEAINIAFEKGDLSTGEWRAVANILDRQVLIESFVRDDGSFSNTLAPGPLGSEGFWSHVQSSRHRLPSAFSLSAPEGDELLGLMQRAIQLDLKRAGITVEVISAPLAVHYGRWLGGGPADASLLRMSGGPGASMPPDSVGSRMLPIAHVDTVVAWNAQAMGLAVNPSLDGVLWNAERWWKDPSL